MSETYTTAVTCENCGFKAPMEIPKGVLVEDFLMDKACNYCECSYKSMMQEYKDN